MPLILKQLWPKPQPPWPNTKIEKIERIPLNGSVVCAQMSGCTLDHDAEPIIKIRGFKPSALPFCFHSFPAGEMHNVTRPDTLEDRTSSEFSPQREGRLYCMDTKTARRCKMSQRLCYAMWGESVMWGFTGDPASNLTLLQHCTTCDTYRL